jgi:hypothetical protein
MHCHLPVIIFVTSRFFLRGSIVEEITGDSWSEFSRNRPKIVKAVCRHQLDVCSRVSGKIGWPHLHINVVQNNEIPMRNFWVDLHTFSKCVFCNFAYVRGFHVSGWRYNALVTKVGLISATRTRLHANTNCVIKYSLHKNCYKERSWILKRPVLSRRLTYSTEFFLKWYAFEETGIFEVL